MNDLIKFLTKNIGLIALVCVTLGLAPFAPEPHIWGKIKWIKGPPKATYATDSKGQESSE